jgi:hypothetical protein
MIDSAPGLKETLQEWVFKTVEMNVIPPFELDMCELRRGLLVFTAQFPLRGICLSLLIILLNLLLTLRCT